MTTANPITLNTTALTFTQYNGPMLTFANGLTKTGNTVSLSSTFTPYDICSCVLVKPDAGGSIATGDLITIVASGTQDSAMSNIAFTIAGNLQ